MNLTVAITGASGAIFGREMLRALEADERVERVHFVASENSLRVMAEELGVSGRNDLLEKLLQTDKPLGAESTESHPSRKNKDAARVGHPDLTRVGYPDLTRVGHSDLTRVGYPDSQYPRSENPDLGHPVIEGRSNKIVQHADADIGAAIASGSYPSNGMIVLPCSMGTLAAIANGMANSLITRAADVTLKERRPLILCVRETPFNRIHLRNMMLAAEAGAVIFPCIPAFYNQPQDSTEMARQFVYRVLAHLGLPQPGAFVWGRE
jgi:polyprenyl P-hydroxybenzoate/phenylacrylic acid decarboxylase-like protein